MRTKVIPPELIRQILSEKFQKRFWSHVKIGTPEECWPWTAFIKKEGYGQITIETIFCRMRIFYSHRIAWIINNKRDSPEGMMVLHSCRASRACCNPNHLRIGTHEENMRDKCDQGMQFQNNQGENHPFAKLTNKDVKFIRRVYPKGLVTQKELGEKFGVHYATIGQIVNGKIWRHI